MRKIVTIILFLLPSTLLAAWVLQATNQTNGVPGVWREPTKGIVYYGQFPPGVNTFTPTFTFTSTPTITNTGSNTPTPTFTSTGTFTLTFTNTPTGSNTPTLTPTGTFTALPTNTPGVPVNPAGVGFPITDPRISGQAEIPVAIDSLNNLYFSNNLGTISMYDVDGNFVKNIGACCGSSNGTFNGDGIDGLVCDSSDNIWAVDDTNGRIMKFSTTSGLYLQKITTNLSNQFYQLAIGPSTGNIYVADFGSLRVRVYTPAGAVVTSWTCNDGLAPIGVCTDLTETWAYVSTGSSHVEKHTIGGTFVANVGSSSPGPGYLQGAAGLWTDFQNNVYVGDTTLMLIEKFTSNGAFLTQWGQGMQVIGSTMFPEFLAGDKFGGFYISDTQLNRVVKTSNTGYPLTHCCGKY